MLELLDTGMCCQLLGAPAARLLQRHSHRGGLNGQSRLGLACPAKALEEAAAVVDWRHGH
jgi:hypothetical protein